MTGSDLPRPIYRDEHEFGCAACRGVCDSAHVDDHGPPALLVPIAEHLGSALADWTRPFHACSECGAIWALAFDEPSARYRQFPTPFGTARALLGVPTLDELLVLLFARAPVDEMVAQSLLELNVDPDQIWNRVIVAWRHPDIDTERKALLLHVLANLVSLRNPHHRELQARRGWLFGSMQKFHRDLTAARIELDAPKSPWAAHHTRALEDLRVLRPALYAPGILRRAGQGVLPLPSRGDENTDAPVPAAPVVSAGEGLRGVSEGSGPPILEQRAEILTYALARTLQILRPYHRFVPALLVGWFLVPTIDANADEASQPLASAFFFAFTLVLHGSAVSVNAGINEGGLGGVIWNRLSVLGDYLLFALLVFVLVLLGIPALSAVGYAPDTGADPKLLWLMAASVLLPSIRLWPYWILPYMQPIVRDEISPLATGIVRRSALSTAWGLTRQPGVFLARTVPWLACLGVCAGVLWVTSRLAGSGPVLVVLHAGVLPVVTAFTWALVETMPDHGEQS